MNLLGEERSAEMEEKIRALKYDEGDLYNAVYGDGMNVIAKTLRKERKRFMWSLLGLLALLLAVGGAAYYNKKGAQSQYKRAEKWKTWHDAVATQLRHMATASDIQLIDHPCNELWHEIHRHRTAIHTMLLLGGAYEPSRIRELVDADGRYVGPGFPLMKSADGDQMEHAMFPPGIYGKDLEEFSAVLNVFAERWLVARLKRNDDE